MKKLLALFLVLTTILSGCSTITESDVNNNNEAEITELSTTVNTVCGEVEGIESEEVLVWYGIPYAKEPTEELRWSEPVQPDNWNETLDCTTPKDAALQVTDGEVTGSEDSLNLDVYSTKDATDLPVLVYIHGGNNQSGTSAELPGFDLVKTNNIVYVSVNYRLGLLGFNNLPSITEDGESTGNFAMLDIAYSLDWVKENIAKFGGDPDNITVSGFSAGGRDVMAMLISPEFEGKFDKAIAFSGGMTLAEEDLSIDKIAQALAPLAIEDNMATDLETAEAWLKSSDAEVKEYLYSLDSDRLVTLMTNAGIRMSVFPHLYKDGIVIPEEGYETTAYNDVPLMMLSGTTEFSFFSMFDPYFFSEAVSGLTEKEVNAAKYFVVKYGS